MTVRLARGTSIPMLVDFANGAVSLGGTWSEVLSELTERFALPFDDARLVMDRVQGGVVRASSRNPANEPDATRDPVAWTSYRLALGLPVPHVDVGLSPEDQSLAAGLLDRARRLEPTRGTNDVGVALEAARMAIASTEGGAAKLHIVLEAATCLSVAAEACIDRLGTRPCSAEGSQEWVDGVQLAGAARAIAEEFARGRHPELEERSYALAGRIVTRVLGQCHAFVGRAMLDSARCIERNGDRERAADHVEPVIADFRVLLDWFADEAPFDEYRTGLEHLLAAVELILSVRDPSAELVDLRTRTQQVLDRPAPN